MFIKLPVLTQPNKVERKHRSILNTTRALRSQAFPLISFWGDCILIVTYLLNGTLVALLHGASPYALLFKTRSCYDHIRIFGTLCYATNLSPNKDKFADRYIKCLFLGYPFGKIAYIVMDLATKKVFTSRDVIFVEDVFPF